MSRQVTHAQVSDTEAENADGAAYADVVSEYAAPSGGTELREAILARSVRYFGSRSKTAFDQK
ncbi:hypothetical protein GCM10010377_06080 [Streptomyces viridiviolaceus]|nr:hypothetical protein GCM10010377_06080 [Streptomyces viridiviolaceus]